MGIATQIPAFFARVGDWGYYICVMTYAQVANQINFQYELDTNRDLQRLMQRGLSDRTADIRKYLLENDHRFLGALVVAAWGGEPAYQELQMLNPDPRAPHLGDDIGLLTFDGSQSYFALDGQHRLRAIKDAVRANPDIGSDQISVLIVPHFDTEGGRLRTRRLFTNINRHAKATSKAENIALDEDDGFAILTRQIISNHPLLKKDGMVRVFTTAPEQMTTGTVRLATDSIPRNSDAWTSIGTLYAMLVALGFDLDSQMRADSQRPNDQVLDQSYQILVERIEALMDSCGDVRTQLTQGTRGRDLRAPKDREQQGHPFMRPIVQKVVAKTACAAADKQVDWPTYLHRLSNLKWVLGEPPWTSVFSVEARRMITGTDNRKLLEKLLKVHVLPASDREIREARKEYRALVGKEYPVSFEEMRTSSRKTV